VNGRPATLILDTGSSMSTLDRDWAAPLGLKESPAPGAAKGVGDVQATLATLDSLRIGSLLMSRERVAILPLRAVSEAHGVSIQGTVGYSIFSQFVVEIDVAGHELRLYEPSTFDDRGHGHALPIDLTMRIPVVTAHLRTWAGSSATARLVLDLGTSGLDVLLTAPFAEAHESWWRDRGVEKPLGTGVGGTTLGRVTTLAQLDVGPLSVRDVVTGIAREHTGFLGATWADGTIGAPVLQRSVITFDYARHRVLMEDAHSTLPLRTYDASGLDLVARGPAFERVMIHHVVAGSAAAECGAAAGDQLVRVDGMDVAGANLDTVHEMLARPGTTRHVILRRGDTEHPCTMQLRPLF
jgi:hypothetical protein